MEMIKALVVVIMLLIGGAAALSINPSTDILTKNADGEIIEIFGPGDFYFDDGQFPNPVTIANGTAYIGSVAKNA